MEEEQRERKDFVEDVRIEKPNSNSNDHDETGRLDTSYHDIGVFTNQIGDVPLENGSTDCFDGRQYNQAEPPLQLGNDLTLPLTDNSQEVISISDDEDEPDVNQYFLNSQPPRPLPPMPMTFPSMMMGPPPPPRHFMPHSLGGPDNVITLSDDDDDDEASSGSKMSGGKKRKRASRRGTMFNPQVCVFCYKPKRENICMAKHLISRHWSRIRSQNMGNSKVTDYSNLKDDREIPADRGLDRRERYERPPPPPLSSLPPPRPLSSAPGSSQAFGRPQPHLIEQPLRPSISSISGFSRPAAFSPGFAGKEERKSLGREVAEELGHPSNRKLVQHQLSMMLHAHKCDGRARKPNSLVPEEERPCVVPNCSNTKELLKHLPACRAETDCLMPKCFMSKQILKWALSEDSPGVMRETRSELNRQIRAGLPSEVVKWATKHPFEAEQWKSWRETKSAGQTNSSPAATSVPANDIKVAQPSQPSLLTSPAATTAGESSIPDWRKKYQLAAEKKKELAAQKMKNGSTNQKVEAVDRIVPSQAPVDILSSLLSAQTATVDLRKGRRPEESKAEARSVPKLVPAPKEAATSGDDAAKYNIIEKEPDGRERSTQCKTLSFQLELIEKLKHSSDLVNQEPSSHLALFVPDQQEIKSGIWLNPGFTIVDYVTEGIIKSGDTVELRLKMRMLKVKMPVTGVVRTLYVDECKTVGQLMEEICPQLRITNHHNFSLAREPREVVRSTSSKKKARKEMSVQSEETTVNWLDENKTLREQNIMESELLLLLAKKVNNIASGWDLLKLSLNLEPSRPGSEVQDWVKCRDWLALPQVTPYSARTTKISKVASERELYNYLKDGIELCRIVGLLTKEIIPDGIIYRTQNLRYLEENNIALFLNIIEKEIRKSNIFGPCKEKAFRNFDNFNTVLKGISELSKFVEKKIEIPSFSISSKSLSTPKYLAEEKKTSTYHEEDEEEFIEEILKDEKEYNDEFYKDYIKDYKDMTVTHLQDAISEMIQNNITFICKVLQNLMLNFSEKLPKNNMLAIQVFPELNLPELLNLHKDLEREFAIVSVSNIEIGSVFERFQDRYLIMCPVVARVTLIKEFLADQMANNSRIRSLVEKLEKDAFADDRKLPDLITMIALQPTKLLLLLHNVVKHALKDEMPNVVHEARKAHRIMKNLVYHINKYNKDSLFIEAMMKLKENIKEFPEDVDLHNLGPLIKEYESIDMKILNSENYKNYQLMIFQDYLGKILDGNLPIIVAFKNCKTVKKYIGHICMKEIEEILPLKKTTWKCFLVLKSFKNNKLDGQNILSFKFPGSKENEARSLRDLLIDLNEKPFSKIATNSHHEDHDYVQYRKDVKSENPVGHLKCGSCQTFVAGKFQTCILCHTCDEYFHEKCFQTETENELQNGEEDIEEDPLIPVEDYAQLYVGETSREYAERLLALKKPGTFLIRYSPTVKQYVLTTINRKTEEGLKCDHSKISYTEVGGLGYYSLRPGYGRSTLLAAVEINRRYLGLLYPFYSPDSKDLNYVEPDQFRKEEEYVEVGDLHKESDSDDFTSNLEENTKTLTLMPKTRLMIKTLRVKKKNSDSDAKNNDDDENLETEDPLPFPLLGREPGGSGEWDHSGETSSWEFYYGDITEEEAEELLCDQVEGTFLLRRHTAGSLVLSRANQTDCEVAQHFVLHTGHNRSYFLISKKEFPSIEDLVEFYQNIDTSNQYWLGLPLLTEKALCKNVENLTDDEMVENWNISRREEPKSLPYYHGLTSNYQARRMLRFEAEGTFLVRKIAVSSQLILSYKSDRENIEHFKIPSSPYYTSPDQAADRTAAISRLVHHLQDKSVLGFGLPRTRPRRRLKPKENDSESSVLSSDFSESDNLTIDETKSTDSPVYV